MSDDDEDDDEGDAGVAGLEGQEDSEEEDVSAASSSTAGSDDSDEFGEHIPQHVLVLWPEAHLQPYLLGSRWGRQDRLISPCVCSNPVRLLLNELFVMYLLGQVTAHCLCNTIVRPLLT